jgi:CheY-like chemotaxis protein
MNVLLIEDDEFKAADVTKVLAEYCPELSLQRATSVSSALKAITAQTFSLVILDMSLPTFELSGPGGGGSPQSQGGLEVLRLATRLEKVTPFIVITQYPDIELDGRDVPLSQAPRTLRSRFGLRVKACILYEFDGDAWRSVLM